MHLAQLDLLPGLGGCEDAGVQDARHSEGPTNDGTDLKEGVCVRGQGWRERQPDPPASQALQCIAWDTCACCVDTNRVQSTQGLGRKPLVR